MRISHFRLVLLTVIMFMFNSLQSQSFEKDDYNELWKKVESLNESGLPRSALEIVDQIYILALKNENQPQLVKAILNRIKLKSDFEENHLVISINELVLKADSLPLPAQQIIKSVIAELYWRYYQMNRYRFLNRTKTINIDKNDIETWDLATIHAAIRLYHLASIDNDLLLKQAPIGEFKAILLEKDDSKKYRPTLFDFLAQRALDYFINDESALSKPDDQFDKNNPELFSDFESFIKIPDRPSPSSIAQSVSILKNLLRFHQNDKSTQAIIDIDIRRLEYIYGKSSHPMKDSLYPMALKNLITRFDHSPYSTDAVSNLAQFLNNQGQLYQPLSSDAHKWQKKEAFEMCANAIEKYPDSEGARKCKALMIEINTPSLSFNLQDVNEPEKPILTLMTFQNVNKVWFRIINMDYESFQELKRTNRNEEIINVLKQKNAINSWEIQLPNDGDFQVHKAEAGLPKLKPGFYVLFASSNSDFSSENHCVTFSDFWVSSISYLSKLNKDGSYDFHILNRTSGQPINNLQARVNIRFYDYKLRDYKTQYWKTFNSDKNGFFKIPKAPQDSASQSFNIEFSTNADKLITEGNFYRSVGERDMQQPIVTTHFFTDRKIYRPGQTIYFKGIMIESLKNDHKILPGKPTRVVFYDVNGQKVSELNFTTNEFGSFNGSFIAPGGTLNGEMRINNETGSIGVNIEEYKLPKFEVKFSKNEDEFKLNQQITTNGKAVAFSGNPVTMAQVRFRVVRNTFYPYRFFDWRIFPGRTQEVEITSGTTTSDEDGNFQIIFQAIPDESVNLKFKPIFNYTIIADVTDINGETRSGQHQVSVGYQSMVLSSNMPDQLNKTKLPKIYINSRNLADYMVSAEVEVNIARLKEPTKLFRERMWDQPDLFIMTLEEFNSKFPNDIYKDEDDFTKWPTEKNWFNREINPKNDSLLDIPAISTWPSGKYKMTLSAKDKSGSTITTELFFTLFDESAVKPTLNVVNWFTLLTPTIEPGNNAGLLFGTSDKSVFAIYEIAVRDQIIEKKIFNLSQELRKFEFPILEDYRGNVAVNIIFIKDNRVYANQAIINVPFTNKELDISFETFRSQLMPGTNEEWKITIKDKDGNRVIAEMLTTMYDAALDMFVPNTYQFQIFNPTLTARPWQNLHNFRTETSRTFYNRTSLPPVIRIQEFDELNWFGYPFFGYFDRRLQLNSPMMAGGKAMREGPAMGMAAEMADGQAIPKTEQEKVEPPVQENKNDIGFQLRRDFRETAFFYPELKTDSEGNTIISFKLPESLTKWKLLGLAHSKDLKSATFEKEIISRKDLMIVPNQPRFLREGDTMSFTAKVVNLANRKLNGNAELHILDALTMKDITSVFGITAPSAPFTSDAGQSVAVNWKMTVPQGYSLIVYRVKAISGQFTDGEEQMLPVLTNRTLVTETMPVWVNGIKAKSFTLKKLSQYNPELNLTLKNYRLTFELTSNPAWYAIQAMPSIVENSFPNTDNIFARFYVNSVAAFLLNSDPKIKNVIESWRQNTSTEDGTGLLSNLEKNQDVKSIVIEETPWIRDANDETQRMQRLVSLFDLNTLNAQLSNQIKRLMELQSPNGGFVWFEGMRESRYITQNIITGFGRLKQRGMVPEVAENDINVMSVKALNYLDLMLAEDFDYIKKYFPDKLEDNHLGSGQIQYLYARSFFREIKVSPKTEEAYEYFTNQAKKYWLKQNYHLQGMIALALYRAGDKKTSLAILKSLKEKSLVSEEMGMYWRGEQGYNWYQSDRETQSLLIEAFEEITADVPTVEMMKLWLLKQKQTQDWGNNRSTVEAVYALIGRGNNWLNNDGLADVKIGNESADPFQNERKPEAGTGYYKINWPGNQVNASMATVEITGKTPGSSWGALYWQYFENLDKVEAQGLPLVLNKQLFRVKNEKNGMVLEPITPATAIKVGDQIKVRIEIKVDRNLEFVHMKDMRASAFEPVNVLSGYKYQDGLGYYETTRDAATHFFFDYLPKGTYIFEYPLIASQKGDFSNGLTTIQCLYAPEFSSHSEGIRVKIGE